MRTPFTRPQTPPTMSATKTITTQWYSAAMACVARVVAQTDDSATRAPTDRSIPPPQITNVMPTLTTPMTDARRRIVMTLSMLANRSPAVAMPTRHSRTRAMTRPRLRPTDPPSTRVSRLPPAPEGLPCRCPDVPAEDVLGGDPSGDVLAGLPLLPGSGVVVAGSRLMPRLLSG